MGKDCNGTVTVVVVVVAVVVVVVVVVMVVPKYLNSSTISEELVSFFILWLFPAF
jgi:TRAP-type C4-dicarboxylate transport system permease small subunit